MNENVFISYSSKEYDEALLLKGILEKNDISCWMAPASIPGGSNYAKEIPRAIKNCRIFVVLLSSNSQSSIWVSKELNQALMENKVIMPYMIENCPLMEQFDFYLSDVQRYDAFFNRSEAIKKMVSEIKGIISAYPSPVIVDDVPEKNKSDDTAKKTDSFTVSNKIMNWLLFLSYFFSIPAGFVVTIPYIIFKLKKNDFYKKVTVVLAILGSFVGLIIYLMALSRPSHLDEAFTTSFIGWITIVWWEL